MRRQIRLGFVSLIVLFVAACGTSASPQAGDCDGLWAELQAARDRAQTYTRERVEGLSNKEIADLPEDPRETQLHAEVERAYEAWQAAGCDQ